MKQQLQINKSHDRWKPVINKDMELLKPRKEKKERFGLLLLLPAERMENLLVTDQRRLRRRKKIFVLKLK